MKISQMCSASRDAADKSHAGRISCGSGCKHHKNDDQRLTQIGKSRLSRIMLEVCIGHKADNGIKSQGRLHSFNSIRI